MVSKEENIMLAAERLFSEKGYEGTSTRDIARAAGVNISMISYYFGSKVKLFEAIFQYRMEQSFSFTQGLLTNPDLDEWEKICQVIDRYCDRVKNLRTFYVIMQREQLVNNNEEITATLRASKHGFLRIYRQLMEKGTERGIFKNSPRLDLLHATITGTIFSAFTNQSIYADFCKEDPNYQDNFFEETKNHIKIIVKHLLGYEKNN